MITRKVAAALAAGCTVVVKPGAETPLSALALSELGMRAGLPPGVLNVVTTHEHVNEVGLELCENKEVKKVSFTGSVSMKERIVHGNYLKGGTEGSADLLLTYKYQIQIIYESSPNASSNRC